MTKTIITMSGQLYMSERKKNVKKPLPITLAYGLGRMITFNVILQAKIIRHTQRYIKLILLLFFLKKLWLHYVALEYFLQ